MMRSDSDLDERESSQVTPEPVSSGSRNDEQEETEISETTDKGSRKEWKKLWRSQKAYWREHEKNEDDGIDDVERDARHSSSSLHFGRDIITVVAAEGARYIRNLMSMVTLARR